MEKQNTKKEIPTIIKITDRGPYNISGNFTVINAKGEQIETKDRVFLCACGNSLRKPFCDGSHKKSEM